MDNNAFGNLIRTYREEHGWKQEELAERWGFTREYVSQIERGKRKLHNPEQVSHLANILGIPDAQLASMGKSTQSKQHSTQNRAERDDSLLQALLEPAHTTVKLSSLLLQGSGILTEQTHNLQNLGKNLNRVLRIYRGRFRQPALLLLASVHELLGKQAVEHTATQEAITQFQAMYDVAEELGDSDLLTLAMIQQSTMFRRTGRFELAFRRLEAAKKRARSASPWLQGYLWKFAARNFYLYGDEQNFLRTIDQAESIAENQEPSVDTITHSFNKLSVLQEKAQGYTMLWQPEKALTIYQEIDKMSPFRPLREQSSYHIVKAQAHCYSGNLQVGIEHAHIGLHIAEQLQSSHYVLRLQQMCDRLRITPIGKELAIRNLRSEILDIRYKLCQRANGW
jgi:transcriptional regulator with XRE-family HTH domain